MSMLGLRDEFETRTMVSGRKQSRSLCVSVLFPLLFIFLPRFFHIDSFDPRRYSRFIRLSLLGTLGIFNLLLSIVNTILNYRDRQHITQSSHI